MVDYQSKYRLYSYGYTAINPRSATPTLRELYHENGRRLFYDRKDRPVHDCRADVVKEHTQPEDWDAWLLSHGLRSTYTDCVSSHEKTRHLHKPPEPSKLLFQIGIKGSAPGDFNFPRGLNTTQRGDILVADSCNHRVQIFNQQGVFKLAFGKQGGGEGEFNEPTDVLELPDGNLAVADRRNKRIQVFSEKGDFVSQISTRQSPYSIACDRHGNLVVCMLGRRVELYQNLQLAGSFPVPASRFGKQGDNCPLHVGITEQGEIIVSDPPDQAIKVFSLEGCLLYQFEPQSHTDGLACSPGGIFVTALGQVLVADLLNHSVSLYTTTGIFLNQVLVPTDHVGCLHSLALGPEGHLVVSEFTMTGEHGVKIFRYRDCTCHKGKRPTSKRRTLTTPSWE